MCRDGICTRLDSLIFSFHITQKVSYLGGEGVKWFRSDFADKLEKAATQALKDSLGLKQKSFNIFA